MNTLGTPRLALPIDSFDCPHGPKNIIDSKNGILIPLKNNLSYDDNLIKLMRNDDQFKKMGINTRSNPSNYRINRVMQIWENMFAELIKKN